MFVHVFVYDIIVQRLFLFVVVINNLYMLTWHKNIRPDSLTFLIIYEIIYIYLVAHDEYKIYDSSKEVLKIFNAFVQYKLLMEKSTSTIPEVSFKSILIQFEYVLYMSISVGRFICLTSWDCNGFTVLFIFRPPSDLKSIFICIHYTFEKLSEHLI